MAWSVEICGKVADTTGLDVSAWMAYMSPSSGTITWSAWVEHLGEMEVAFDKLAVSNDYIESVEHAARLFTGPAVDGLDQLIHGAPAAEGPKPAYATVVRTAAVNGKLGAAFAAAVELAEAAAAITGNPTRVLAEVTGQFGGIGWLAGHESLEAIAAGQAKLDGDSSWLTLVDKVAPLFSAETRQSMFRRIA